ncbi:TMEM175 family protein [Rheinheimera sp. F8]|uniref:TMEM175 family protein n=1 Tax=Rheinheimera sp. F8 TaxID=1763998 RepID=UPI000744BB2E|nr:TMEM175 family protein [Rheinheimera sp. F8]ALZ74929.1 hypothetical protein ATY27_03575 [Rheinheimera sp. F8]
MTSSPANPQITHQPNIPDYARTHLQATGVATAPQFQQRGLQTTRIETLTDAAFAFAFTLLVIGQGKVPMNYNELLLAVQHIPSFLISVAMLGTFWYGHHKWSRRTGLDDGISVLLSFVLVLLVLIYVYPLKAVFSSMLYWFSGGYFPVGIQLESMAELSGLFLIYSLGYAFMAACLVALQWHALRAPQPLPFTTFERTVLRLELQSWTLHLVVALSSALIAATVSGEQVLWAGFIYGSFGLVMPLFGWYARLQKNKVIAAL